MVLSHHSTHRRASGHHDEDIESIFSVNFTNAKMSVNSWVNHQEKANLPTQEEIS